MTNQEMNPAESNVPVANAPSQPLIQSAVSEAKTVIDNAELAFDAIKKIIAILSELDPAVVTLIKKIIT